MYVLNWYTQGISCCDPDRPLLASEICCSLSLDGGYPTESPFSPSAGQSFVTNRWPPFATSATGPTHSDKPSTWAVWCQYWPMECTWHCPACWYFWTRPSGGWARPFGRFSLILTLVHSFWIHVAGMFFWKTKDVTPQWWTKNSGHLGGGEM